MFQDNSEVMVDMGLVGVSVEITYAGCPASWSEWSGGHPGDPVEFEIREIFITEDGQDLSLEGALDLLGYTAKQFQRELDEKVAESIERRHRR